MAASEIDQRILGHICRETEVSNPLLSSALYQVLGLSVRLSRKLFRARKVRRLDPTRDTKSLTLYHHIIWLAREGLAITEALILPFCQNGDRSRHCRVMAAKLRASFYHVFCLFHNNPAVNYLSPKRTSPSSPGRREQEAKTRTRRAALRDAIPSMTSEASYITNPYAAEGPALSPPPSYPVPSIPSSGTPQGRRTPLRPPGLNLNGSPPSSADFLMPSQNFVPVASVHFASAAILARKLLPGSDPLRLSVALEYCAFTWDCGKEYKAAGDIARQALRDVFKTQEGMDDADFEEANALVQAIAVIAKRGGGSLQSQSTSRARKQSTPSEGRAAGPQQKSMGNLDSSQTVSSYAQRELPPIPVFPQPPSNALERDAGPSNTESRSTTLVPPSEATVRNNSSSGESARKSRTSHAETQRSGNTRQDKARKRSILERAEEEARRRAGLKDGGSGGTGSRQTTLPQMVGVTDFEAESRVRTERTAR